MSERVCCIHGCGRKHYGKFLCNTHYLRLRLTGTTNKRVREPKLCRMPNCDKRAEKHRWCGKHWTRIQKNGSPLDKAQKWVVRDYPECVVCKGPINKGNGFRRYCSQSCAVIANRGKRPGESACGQCGTPLDMTERNEAGRLISSNRAYCEDCRGGVNLRKYVAPLFERDGADCSICGDAIDMTLVYPHPKSRSVDHVLPRSLGGTEDMSNLALACLICNITKQARVGFTMAGSSAMSLTA